MQIETTAETLAPLGLTLDTLADRILTQAAIYLLAPLVVTMVNDN